MAKSSRKQQHNNNGAGTPSADTVTCVYLAITPCYFSHNGTEYYLNNNETYQLPNIAFIQSLIGQGRLVKK